MLRFGPNADSSSFGERNAATALRAKDPPSRRIARQKLLKRLGHIFILLGNFFRRAILGGELLEKLFIGKLWLRLTQLAVLFLQMRTNGRQRVLRHNA